MWLTAGQPFSGYCKTPDIICLGELRYDLWVTASGGRDDEVHCLHGVQRLYLLVPFPEDSTATWHFVEHGPLAFSAGNPLIIDSVGKGFFCLLLDS